MLYVIYTDDGNKKIKWATCDDDSLSIVLRYFFNSYKYLDDYYILTISDGLPTMKLLDFIQMRGGIEEC